jgi:hypothetical protein
VFSLENKANDFLLPQSDFASLCSEGLDFHLQMFLQHHVQKTFDMTNPQTPMGQNSGIIIS